MVKKRLDVVLVGQNLVQSRSRAHTLIKEGRVWLDGGQLKKCGALVEEDAQFQLRMDDLDDGQDGQGQNYVGRGYFKLKAAIEAFAINPQGMTVADFGASTGGFTQFLLTKGITYSYAIDVGHDQLSPVLREDPRVNNLEGVNIKNPLQLPQSIDLAVVDLSFISLRKVLANIFANLKENGEVVALFKPQFEVGRKGLGKKGVVKEQNVLKNSLLEFYQWCRSEERSYGVADFIPSPILGKKEGNQEFFFHLIKNQKRDLNRDHLFFHFAQ